MKIFEFWQNPDGSLSSRRLFGTALLTVAIAGYFSKLDAILTGAIFAFGTTLLAVTTADPQKPGGAA
jgi:hypothetical protein